jgi:hypothetical protein
VGHDKPLKLQNETVQKLLLEINLNGLFKNNFFFEPNP